jgi:hypothetical protein
MIGVADLRCNKRGSQHEARESATEHGLQNSFYLALTLHVLLASFGILILTTGFTIISTPGWSGWDVVFFAMHPRQINTADTH